LPSPASIKNWFEGSFHDPLGAGRRIRAIEGTRGGEGGPDRARAILAADV